jgi:hypothetical protein
MRRTPRTGMVKGKSDAPQSQMHGKMPKPVKSTQRRDNSKKCNPGKEGY